MTGLSVPQGGMSGDRGFYQYKSEAAGGAWRAGGDACGRRGADCRKGQAGTRLGVRARDRNMDESDPPPAA